MYPKQSQKLNEKELKNSINLVNSRMSIEQALMCGRVFVHHQYFDNQVWAVVFQIIKTLPIPPNDLPITAWIVAKSH
jgi:hypothetical protein